MWASSSNQEKVDKSQKVKFGHSEKATKIRVSKRQIKWEIVSNFVAFLENLNFTFTIIFNKVHEITVRQLFNIHYAPLMMSQKVAHRKHTCVLPKKVACLV